jgi:competence protein ComFB
MVSNNLLEQEVREQVEEILEEKDELCSCEQCHEDIVALALSNLKPRYAGSKEGEIILNSVDISSEQTRLDILRSVLEAAEKVNERPHHHR